MSKVRKPSDKRKAGPAPNSKPKVAAPDDRPGPVANAFPEAGPHEMFSTVVGIMRWHVEQMESQLRFIDKDPLWALSETAGDALKVCALARLLWEAADTAR